VTEQGWRRVAREVTGSRKSRRDGISTIGFFDNPKVRASKNAGPYSGRVGAARMRGSVYVRTGSCGQAVKAGSSERATFIRKPGPAAVVESSARGFVGSASDPGQSG